MRGSRAGDGGLAIANFCIFPLQRFNSPLDVSAVVDASTNQRRFTTARF
jgi:hypothetical protein